MFISKSTAQTLIKEISSIIDYDINIMNEEGVIIASTNPSRIGQHHEGASLIVKNNLNELLIYYDDAYRGCKKGINLPITLNGSIVGVIGITGVVSEIMRYGNLIRKVTEILMKDLFKLQQLKQKEMEKQNFVSCWLNGDIENRSELEQGIEKYNLYKHAPFVVAIIKTAVDDSILEPAISEKLNRKGILATYSNGLGIVISNQPSVQKCSESISSALEAHSDSYLCAVGTCQTNYEGVQKSYQEAKQVLQLKETAKKGIYLFDDELFNVIIDDVTTEYKLKFSSKTFRNCSQEETLNFIDFINIYAKSNGSINSIASELFVHKNTVQYKINKILQLTGLDLRKLDNFTALYFAAKWYPH